MSSDLMAAVQPKLFMTLVCLINVVPSWLLRRDTGRHAVRMLSHATLLFGIGLPLLLFKDWLPSMPAAIVGNMMVLAAVGLLWQVVSLLGGRTSDCRLVLVAPLAWMMCWLATPFRAEPDLRVAAAAAMTGLLVMLAVIDILRTGIRDLPQWLLIGTGVLHVVVCVLRVVLAAGHRAFAGSAIWITATELNTLMYMMLWPTLCLVLLNRQSLRAEAEHARRDELSGLLNRRGVLQELASAGPGILLLFDIDHFKRINDRLGHAAGDVAIVSFARLAERELGALPLGRIGGEEFVALVPGRDQVLAWTTAERMRAAFASLDLCDGIRATVSVGMAAYVTGEPIHMQLARADRALYRAKRLGRDRIELCDGPAPAHAEVPEPCPPAEQDAFEPPVAETTPPSDPATQTMAVA